MMWGTGMGFGLGFGWIAMVLFWVFLVAGTIWLVRSLAHSGPEAPASEQGRAARILAERFARGEIDAEEYRARGRALEER